MRFLPLLVPFAMLLALAPFAWAEWRTRRTDRLMRLGFREAARRGWIEDFDSRSSMDRFRRESGQR